jgi:acetyl-CoA acetyltransferase
MTEENFVKKYRSSREEQHEFSLKKTTKIIKREEMAKGMDT